MNWETILASSLVAALVASIVSLIGHFISRKNATLAASISAENASLAASISRENASLAAEISKQNEKLRANLQSNVKLAEFRQNWINDLRTDMAKINSIGVTPSADHSKNLDFYDLMARIQLRMNPEDENYEDLNDCLYDLLNKSVEEKYGASPKFIHVSQKILKREWDTLKAEIESVSSSAND
ncbi:hypothetical protein [Parasphingorhabdus sp. NYA22]